MDKIAVAMSGGVDSSVAAALLARAGHEVVGITLRLAPGDSDCCASDGAERAARVAASVGIPHYVWDYRDLFETEVMSPFVAGYFKGSTPNPCLACNGRIKFDAMLTRVRDLGFDALATGHYARIVDGVTLARASDASKDQSYALYMIERNKLPYLRFPLGDLAKTQVRQIAQNLGLASAKTPESQDVCFVDGDVGDWVLARAGHAGESGPVVDELGRKLGTHEGIHRFTVGQRRGTGVAVGERRYVVDLDPVEARVVVGPEESLLVDCTEFSEANWLCVDPEGRVEVMTRYRGPLASGSLQTPSRLSGCVLFESPIKRPSPGQAVVCYRGDVVVGGGIAC